MKKLIPFIILYWLFVILCPGTKAQWEGAEVQRLTYNDLPNKSAGLYIDHNDKLYLFYLEGLRDTISGFVYDYTIFYITKAKGAEWSQPEEIEPPVPIFGQNRRGGLWMDTRTGIIHILYSSLAGDSYDDTLYYTNSNIPNWEFVKIDSLPGQQWHADYHSFDMDFDSLRNVHLAWHVDFDSIDSGWYKVMYANNSTGEWVKQQVSPSIFLGGMGSGPTDFSVQRNGSAHILYFGDPYCGLACQSSYVRNDSLNGTSWITDTVPKPPRPLWHYGASVIEVSVDDTVHLITGGCVDDDCVEPGRYRTFYYHRDAEDGIWQGPEQIPDTLFGFRLAIDQLLIDEAGVPYASYSTSTGEVYFTDRKQGSWQVPYALVGWQEDPDSLMVDAFSFVLDSEGRGHGAFHGLDVGQVFDNDSMEIYLLSCSNSAVDTSPEAYPLDFSLSQNYPNPFNSSTIITYEIIAEANVALKIYDILGREVRKLVNRCQKPGYYKVNWDGRNNQGKEVASGIYFYQLTVRQAHRPEQSQGKAGDYRETKKLVLIK